MFVSSKLLDDADAVGSDTKPCGLLWEHVEAKAETGSFQDLLL